MSDLIHLVPEQGAPGPGARLPDPGDWVLGERVHDSGVLQAFAAPGGLVWVLSDLSQREAMVQRNAALAKLRHPQIQEVAGIGLIGGHPYRADPDPEGIPLDTLMQQHGPFGVSRALDLSLQLAELLVELHGRGLVHGHIHPGALRLHAEQLILGDIPPLLGLNLPHAPPEAQLGAEADPRADLFGLGYTTLCLLRGSRPDGDGRHRSWRSGKAGPIAPLPPAVELPQEIDALLRALLDRDPERRPRSALEVSQILARARGPQRKPPSLKIVALALGGVVLFAGLNLAYEQLAQPPTSTPPAARNAPPVQPPKPAALPVTSSVASQAEPAPEAPAAEIPQDPEPVDRSPIPPSPQPVSREPLPSPEPPSEVENAAPTPDPEAVTEPEPVLAEVAPEPTPPQPPAAPSLAHFSGTYTGAANGRPLRIELQVDADGNAQGVAEQSLGSQAVRAPLRGSFAEDGRFTLVESEGARPNTWSGVQSGDTMSGQLSSGGRSRGQWSASR